MPGDGELQGPAGYDDRWLTIAVIALAVVALYYVVVLFWFRRRRPPRVVPKPPDRESCLARINEIESAVRAGALSPREGHQKLSAAVRTFVTDASGVPAASMTLTDLRREGPDDLAGLVALIYPPAFVGDDRVARDRFNRVVDEARRLVEWW